MFENLPEVSLDSSYTFWDHDGKRVEANSYDYLELLTELNPYLAAAVQNCADEVATLCDVDYWGENWSRVFDAVIKTMLGVLGLIDGEIATERLKIMFRREMGNNSPF